MTPWLRRAVPLVAASLALLVANLLEADHRSFGPPRVLRTGQSVIYSELPSGATAESSIHPSERSRSAFARPWQCRCSGGAGGSV
jgi:hypothetical protein